MLSLFSGELGELVRLADDVSNDCVQLSASPTHKSDGVAAGDLVTGSGIDVAQEFDFRLAFTLSAKPGQPSGSSLLRLLVIQRK